MSDFTVSATREKHLFESWEPITHTFMDLLDLPIYFVDLLSNIWHTIISALLIPFGGDAPLPVHRPNLAQALDQNPPAILITGTSSGMGLDMTKHFVKKGYRVFAGVRTSEDATKVRNVANSVMSQDQRFGKIDLIEPIILDVRNPKHIQSALNTVQSYCSTGNGASFAGIVLNAAVLILAPFELVDDTMELELFSTNLMGPIRLTKAFLPLLRATPGSRILAIGTVGALSKGIPGYSYYVASKAGLEMLMLTLRKEVKQFGIGVSIIDPGFTRTPMWPKAVEGYRHFDAITSTEPPKGYLENSDAKGPLATSLPSYASPKDVVSPELKQVYATSVAKLKWTLVIAKILCLSDGHVINAVDHAMTSSLPKMRYLCGLDTRVWGAVKRAIPEALVDWAAGLAA